MNRFSPDHRLKLLVGAAFLLPAMPASAAELGTAADAATTEAPADAAAADGGCGEYDGFEAPKSSCRRVAATKARRTCRSRCRSSVHPQLEQTGNYTLTQIQQIVPSLQVFSFNPRNTNINIRGLGSNVALTNDGLENGVGFYVDNVYFGRVGQSQFDLVDLAADRGASRPAGDVVRQEHHLRRNQHHVEEAQLRSRIFGRSERRRLWLLPAARHRRRVG